MHVLLSGETGAGKDELARRIHALSARHDRPFVKITCATYTHQLLESELFGHEAWRITPARTELSPGGLNWPMRGVSISTDVDDIPLEAQTRLTQK